MTVDATGDPHGGDHHDRRAAHRVRRPAADRGPGQPQDPGHGRHHGEVPRVLVEDRQARSPTCTPPPTAGHLSDTIGCWKDGLVGQTLGSRLLLVVPAVDGVPERQRDPEDRSGRHDGLRHRPGLRRRRVLARSRLTSRPRPVGPRRPGEGGGVEARQQLGRRRPAPRARSAPASARAASGRPRRPFPVRPGRPG